MAEEIESIVGTSTGVLETGEGSLLVATRDLVEEHSKATLEFFQTEHGLANVPIVRDPRGNVTVLNPSQFDAYRIKPLRRTGTAKLTELQSLIDYINAYKDGSSAVFADDTREAPKITAVLDYNSQGGPNDGGQRFGQDRAGHALPLSDEWKAWNELDGDQVTMLNFARFLEDHIVDVLPVGMVELSEAQEKFVKALGGFERIADPNKLMELATGLRVNEQSEVSEARNLQSGEGELVLRSQHVDASGSKLVIPSMFVIAIPVFRNGPPYQIIVRLRYRRQGGISFIYEMWRADLVFDHAFNEAVQAVADGTSLPVYRGSPNA